MKDASLNVRKLTRLSRGLLSDIFGQLNFVKPDRDCEPRDGVLTLSLLVVNRLGPIYGSFREAEKWAESGVKSRRGRHSSEW